jgi:hypothetical protein
MLVCAVALVSGAATPEAHSEVQPMTSAVTQLPIEALPYP